MPSFSVRSVCRWQPRPEQRLTHLYEERITLWRADDIDAAMRLAAEESARYCEDGDCESLDFQQAFALVDVVEADGIEVFSLLRESDLAPGPYLDTFFDNGHERTTRGA